MVPSCTNSCQELQQVIAGNCFQAPRSLRTEPLADKLLGRQAFFVSLDHGVGRPGPAQVKMQQKTSFISLFRRRQAVITGVPPDVHTWVLSIALCRHAGLQVAALAKCY